MKLDKNITKLLAYIIFFSILFVFLSIEVKNKETKENNLDTKQNNSIINSINEINDDYYIINIQAILKNDAITLNYEKQNDVITGLKSYHNELITFVKYNNDYYILSDNAFTKQPDFISFNYDKTFIEVSNIKDLINLTHKEKIDGSILINTYSLNDVINLYNKINNTNYYITEDSNLNIYLKTHNDILDFIIIDMTPLYKLIDNNIDTVYYKIEIKEVEKTDVSPIIDKLN